MNYNTFYPKKCHKALGNISWGSGKNLSQIPGTKKHRIPDLDPQNQAWIPLFEFQMRAKISHKK
jgi:hypothetical protein